MGHLGSKEQWLIVVLVQEGKYKYLECFFNSFIVTTDESIQVIFKNTNIITVLY